MSGYGQQELDLYADYERKCYAPEPGLLDAHELALVAHQATVKGPQAPEWKVLRCVIRNDWQVEVSGATVSGSFGIVHAGVRAAIRGTVSHIEDAIENFASRHPGVGNSHTF